MTDAPISFVERLQSRLGEKLTSLKNSLEEITIEIRANHLLDVARILRDDEHMRFDTMIDLCGVDYLSYGNDEWDTESVSNAGFSRGVEGVGPGRFGWQDRPNITNTTNLENRFAVVIHLLSVTHNRRLRVRAFTLDESFPTMPSVVEIWPAANWFEREAFDLFGILFEGHPDLRRLLTDYGFVGHPFRKDFPLIGNVEVRYDEVKGRVVYEAVTSVEPRVGVPRTIRHDSRIEQSKAESAAGLGK